MTWIELCGRNVAGQDEIQLREYIRFLLFGDIATMFRNVFAIWKKISC